MSGLDFYKNAGSVPGRSGRVQRSGGGAITGRRHYDGAAADVWTPHSMQSQTEQRMRFWYRWKIRWLAPWYGCTTCCLGASWRFAEKTILPILLALIGFPSAKMENIRSVASHPMALAQCEDFFQEHANLKRVPRGGHGGKRTRK